jgi:flagellar biosynthesis/type III secretory pathway chaperone
VENIELLHQVLQKLIGLHRQLLDTVRLERDALVQANLKDIQEATFAKQALIEAIRQTECQRISVLEQVAKAWGIAPAGLTLSEVIIRIQGSDIKTAELLRSVLNTLTILVKRVSDQNDENRILVDGFLNHLAEMKKNVMGESLPRSDVYNQAGKRAPQPSGARLISKEV